MIIQGPYEWIILLIVIGFFIKKLAKPSGKNDWLDAAQEKSGNRFNYNNQTIIDASKARKEKEARNIEKKKRLEQILKENPGALDGERVWYPTGWTLNEETGLWEAPDYVTESAKKWEWDDEKLIWIDKERKARLERYQQFRKEQGKEPTFEEWKAARQKETEKNNTPGN